MNKKDNKTINIDMKAEGESIALYLDDTFVRYFNNYPEYYQNRQDAEQYIQELLRQKGYVLKMINKEGFDTTMKAMEEKKEILHQEDKNLGFKKIVNRFGNAVVLIALTEIIQKGLMNYDDKSVETAIQSLSNIPFQDVNGKIELMTPEFKKQVLLCCNTFFDHFNETDIISLINNELIISNDPKNLALSMNDFEEKGSVINIEYNNKDSLIQSLISIIDSLYNNRGYEIDTHQFIENMELNNTVCYYSITDENGNVFEDVEDYLDSEEDYELE